MAEAALPPAAYPQAAHTDRKMVWLTSFPKSGNTWTRILIGHFLGEAPDDDDEDSDAERIAPIGSITSNRRNFDEAIALPSSDMTAAEVDLLRPAAYRHIAAHAKRPMKFMKSHDGFHRNAAGADIFPADCSRGGILIVRHPMDVALSYAHHLGHSDVERAVRSLCDPRHTMSGDGKRQLQQVTLGWSGHYLSWTRQDRVPLLVVRYEDMLADTAREFARMARFLGVDGADDPERIADAVALSRFERLKGIESRTGFSEIPVNASAFFRSGRAGEGIAQLTPKQRQRILDVHGPVMAELGYSQDGTDRL